jgi:predicted neuraminidase
VVKLKATPWLYIVSALVSAPLPCLKQADVSPPTQAFEQLSSTFHVSSHTGLEEGYLPKLFRSSHAANLVKLQNGDLLCFWFSGTEEGESNVAIVMSRLPNKSKHWSETVEIDHQPGRSFQNPVAFQTLEGRLWLLHTSQAAGQGQANAEVLYLTSDDAGRTWTAPQPLLKTPGSFIRQPPILTSRKVWLLPMYYTPSRDITHGAESNYSAVKITDDGGRNWKECNVPKSDGLVQLTVVRLTTGRFVGFFRSRFADFIYRSSSRNGCDWSGPAATHLPNNNSSIQSTLLTDGFVAIAFNNSNAGAIRGKPRTSARKPLSIALSADGGETWPWVRDIETGDVEGLQNEDEEYSYPSLLQQANGKIVVAYTYRRETIKVVRFQEDWIKRGSTAGRFKGDTPK